MPSSDHPGGDEGLRLPVGRIDAALRREGWCVVDDALPPPLVLALAAASRAHARGGALQDARTGRGAAAARDEGVRGDRIRWLAADTADAAEATLLAALESLRAGLNARLYLGLVEVEAHHACYAPGARYAVHRDRFRDDDSRVLSIVAYLNADWRATDGGALRLYLDPARERFEDILPLGGRLVAFLSADFEHEVLPATRERLSIAAWLRRRPLPG